MSQKATREGVKEHNRRLILRSVFSGEADSRAALAQVTRLAKPTVSDLISELMEEGFIEESGVGESTESGGKRPRLLRFQPTARQIIGVSIDGLRVMGVLAQLDGEVIARHRTELDGAQDQEVLTILQDVINALIAQHDAPLMCLSIGTPGIVQNGFVKSSPMLGWYNFPLMEHLNTLYDLPVYISNNTELAVRAATRAANRTDNGNERNLVMVLVNKSVEIGIAFSQDGLPFFHHSGDLGLLRVPPTADRLSSYLGWGFVKKRIEELRAQAPQTELQENPRYLDIRQGYLNGDWLATTLYDELAGHLSQVFAWITGLMRPDHIALAGDIVELGDHLLKLGTARTSELLPPDLVDAVTFSLADDLLLSVSGTIDNAVHQELGL